MPAVTLKSGEKREQVFEKKTRLDPDNQQDHIMGALYSRHILADPKTDKSQSDSTGSVGGIADAPSYCDHRIHIQIHETYGQS